MKKNSIFPIIIIFCIVIFGNIGCQKPPVVEDPTNPCKEGVYKAVDDGFITGIAMLKDGRAALYMDLDTFYVQNGLEPYGDPPEVSFYNVPISGKTKEDECGVYAIIPAEKKYMKFEIFPCAKGEDGGCTIYDNLIYNTKFLCPKDEFLGTLKSVCVIPAALFESL